MLSDKIAEQILAIRAGGTSNMFDTHAVQAEADRQGFYELVIFIEEHKDAYVRFILSGDRG